VYTKGADVAEVGLTGELKVFGFEGCDMPDSKLQMRQ